MLQYLKLVIWCCIVRGSYAVRLPPSPCPNIFAYEGEPEQDRWFGVITFSSNIELVGLNYKVQLDRPSQLLVSWDGDVRTSDNINYSVFDPFHKQRAGEIVRARIMVKYGPYGGPPAILRIIINGNTMCASNDGNTGSGTGIGLSNDHSTERPDPAFGENEDIASEFSNNRGQSNNYGGGGNNHPNYNVNSPNYGSQNRPIEPTYEPPNYVGANAPSNYNPSSSSNSGFGNNYVPSNTNYGNSGGSNSNKVHAGGNQNGGSGVPNYGNNNNPAYGNGDFASGSDSVNYGTGGRPQWSDTSSSAVANNNRTGATNWQGSGFSNSQSTSQQVVETTANSGPIVTTLTLPSNSHNKTNIDQIVQIIKNQLEQQQFTQNNNKTVIVAVVNPASSSTSQVSSANAAAGFSSSEQSGAYRSTTTTTVSNTKTRIVPPTTKSPNGHRANKD